MNEPLYTPEEFADEMRRLNINIEHTEDRHIEMDDAMCALLISLGYEEGIEVFIDAKKWYA